MTKWFRQLGKGALKIIDAIESRPQGIGKRGALESVVFRLEKKLNQEGTCLTLDGDISTECIDVIETSCDEAMADGKPVDLFYHPRFGIQHLADLTWYCQGQERLGALYADPDAWARKAILNIASSGKFSSDRTITEYANDIWKAGPCPVT